LKFDETHKVFEVSVGELAEQEQFYRIGFEGAEGWRRLGMGAELHARVLKERCSTQPGYRSEVHLQAQVPLEEFKSAFLPGQELRRSSSFQRHQHQLLLYCDLWRRLGHSPVTGALVYLDLSSGREISTPVSYNPAAWEPELERRLARLLAIWQAQSNIRQAKAAAAAALPFPHQAPRPGQTKMIDSVRQALQSGGNLMAQAPTGSGKTAASLHPALADGLANGRQILFLTAKTLQQTLAVAALGAMNSSGAFRTLQIRAKEKMCANDRVLCHEDFCPYAKDYGQKMAASNILQRLARSHRHYDPDTVFAEAKKERVCPFAVQLELARRADVIVADYNYVFEPGAALRHLDNDQPFTLLVDEAHNLPERARKIFSPDLLEEVLRGVVEHLVFKPAEPFGALSRIIEDVIALLVQTAQSLPQSQTIAQIDPPSDRLLALWKEWEPHFIAYLAWKREVQLAAPLDPIVDLHFAWQRWIATLHFFGPGFACVIEKRDTGVRLGIVCLDPARTLAPVFRAAAATILLSATLSPFDVMRRTLGLEKERTAAISFPPPFPPEHRKIMVVPQVRTTFAARQENFGPIARLIGQMSAAQSGNGLVLFPSYKFLEEVAARLPPTRASLLVQRPNLPDAERRRIFQELAAPPPRGILLLAVLGGMYAEGVDYPGELLSAVYIVSPGLPQVSFERELLRHYFDQTEQAGFEYAYLQPGMTRVIQAAGRLIRSETDRGVIVLLCRRFLQAPYLAHLPRDWYDRSPAELIAAKPDEEIRDFFATSP
jgi:DNA excision repair protein ERCC-2